MFRYLAQMGMLEREGVTSSLPNVNPLAVYAVWEAVSGGGGDLASPVVVEERLAVWRTEGGIESFKSDLTLARGKRYAAYLVFGILIATVFDLVIESGMSIPSSKSLI